MNEHARPSGQWPVFDLRADYRGEEGRLVVFDPGSRYYADRQDEWISARVADCVPFESIP